MDKIASKANRFNIAAILIICVSFLAVYVYVFDSKLDLNGDNASYYTLGKALAQGEGYVNISNVSKTPNNHFPPGYPAIIAGLISIFPDSVITLKIANGFFFLAALLIIYAILLKIIDNKWLSLIIVLLVLLNGHFLRYSTIVMSEVPFLFISSLVLLFFLNTEDSKQQLKDPWFYATLLAIGVSYYIRSLGVALLGGVLLHLALNKNWSHIPAYIIGFAVMFIPWFLRGKSLGGNSYMSQLVKINPYQAELGDVGIADVIQRVLNNFQRYVSREFQSAMFPQDRVEYMLDVSLYEWIIGVLLVSIVVYGLVHLPKFKWLVIGYLSSTFAILMIWPDVWIGVRFILPSVPLLLLPFCFGLHRFLDVLFVKLGVGGGEAAVVAVGLLILPMLGSMSLPRAHAQENYEPGWENYFRLGVWLKANGSPADVVACRKPTMFYLFSGTSTTNYKFTPDADELIQDLRDRNVKFVILDQLGYSSTIRYLYPAIRDNPEHFNSLIELTSPNTYLLEFIP